MDAHLSWGDLKPDRVMIPYFTFTIDFDVAVIFIFKLIFTAIHALTYWEWSTIRLLTYRGQSTHSPCRCYRGCWRWSSQLESICNESDSHVSHMDFQKAIDETHYCAYPIHTYIDFSKSLLKRRVQFSLISCIASHSDVGFLAFFFLRRGGGFDHPLW